MTMFGERSSIHESLPTRKGEGTSRIWSREISGTLYSFTAVLMPNGERRYFVNRFNGYVGGPKWACAWEQVHAIIVKPA